MTDRSRSDAGVPGLYSEVRQFFDALHAPGTQSITDACDLCASPDGLSAALTGTVFHDLESPPVTRIGILSLETGTLSIRFAAEEADGMRSCDRLPRYSPDGRRLAFLSDRAERGNFQLHLADVAQHSVEAFPPLDGVIESLSWSPDGSRLLLGVAGFGADMAGAQGGARTLRKSDGAPDWFPSVDTGDADNLWRSAYVLDLAARRYHRASPLKLNIWECVWVSDTAIAAVVSESHSEGSWYTARLVTIEAADAAVRDRYWPTDQIGCPAVSPRGRYCAVIEAVCSDRLIVCGAVRIVDLESGSVLRLDTGGVDATQVIWRDEDTVVFVGIRGLETVLGTTNVPGNRVTENWSSLERTMGAWYPSVALAQQDAVLAVAESYSVPPEVALIDQRGYRAVRSLATSASAAQGFNTGLIEPMTWTARDGLEIQGWLLKPAGPGPFPVVMDIHGGPVWACRNRWQGRLRGAKVLADRGIASLFPNPRGSSGRGGEFARLVKGDMGGEDTHDYLSALDALVVRGIADPARLGVTGISYGGFMSAWLVTQDTRFAAAVPISTVSNWYSQHHTSQIPYFDALFLDGKPVAPNGLFFERSPLMSAHRVRTPVLQLTGGRDQNTPPTQALEFHRALLEHGVRSVLATYPTSGHGIRGFPEVIDATTRYVSWFLEHFDREIA